jgi:hypothetical protein
MTQIIDPSWNTKNSPMGQIIQKPRRRKISEICVICGYEVFLIA